MDTQPYKPTRQMGGDTSSRNYQSDCPESDSAPPETTSPFGLQQLLRSIGMLSIMAALGAFLLDNWADWHDLSRYYVLLGGTASLVALGWLTGFRFNDSNSARAFVGLALIATVANFATLGAFVFDWAFPGQTGSLSTAVLAAVLLCSLLLLWPLSRFAYQVLARGPANIMSLLFMLSNLLLLAPWRESGAIGVLLIAAVAPALIFWLTYKRDRPYLSTKSGRFALVSLFAPFVVMLARTLWLYEADLLVLWMLSGLVFVALYQISYFKLIPNDFQAITGLTLIPLAAVWSGINLALLKPYLVDALLIPCFGLMFSGLIYSLSLLYRSYSNALQLIAGCTLTLIGMVTAIAFDTTVSDLAALVSSLILFAVGHLRQQASYRVMSAALLAVVILPYFWSAFAMLWSTVSAINFAHWSSLAVIGVGAILTATLIDVYRRRHSANG